MDGRIHFRRKIDGFLQEWKNRADRNPLIVKGARQVGKTTAIRRFSRRNYESVIEINFALQAKYRTIFDDGFEVNDILKNISLIDPALKFIPGDTLFFFDELQKCPNAATALKSFKEDGRFDVICSGSLLGVNYREIESNSVGFKEDYKMYSMDFEEFLWALGYTDLQIEEMYRSMLEIKPLSETEISVMFENFSDYMVVGGMPAIVAKFVSNRNFSGILEMQRQINLDYEEDITKYSEGLEQTRILNTYRKVPAFLGNENKKFQVSKVENGARSREYLGTVDWLERAGIVNVCYCLNYPELPLKGNYNPDNFRVFMGDTGLLVGALDDEAQEDLRANKNLNTYKGALYENIIAEMLQKQGYNLYFYKNEKSTIEMDFFVRDKDSLIPIEVKAVGGATVSLNNLIKRESYSDIRYGIKFCHKNIGFNGEIYTFPYFLAFLLKRWVRERS